MRDVPLDADRATIERLVDWNTRLLGSPAEERGAAMVAVESALEHPLLARANVSARCHREYPLVLNLEDGRVFEGFIDLAFLEDGQWVIVDFKTDSDTTERRAQYERQLQWYGFALTRLTNMPAQAWLLQM
jgi:ATP-dependent helicase/nuclease subunit A